MSRKRQNSILVRLNDDELEILESRVNQTGLSREAYLRKLISGVVPINEPSADYLYIMKQLRYIGNNVNQIAMVANKFGDINAQRYSQDSIELKLFIKDMLSIFDPTEKFDYRKVIKDDGTM